MASVLPGNPHLPKLRKRVGSAPKAPGIYRWLNEEGTVLYVGKAKELRNRLRSYVSPGKGANLGVWKESMMSQAADFDVTVTTSELEALVLETNLIKQLRPKYNVLMKDDKNYVYVRVTTQDPYPRIEVVRQMEDDGAKYFGPKTSAEQVRGTLAFLRKIFPFRTCKMEITPLAEAKGDTSSSIPLELPVECKYKDRPTPCLDFHIGHCSAPCIGRISPERYRSEIIDGVLQFLKGNHEAVETLLTERMKRAAADKKFELAARLRDQLTSIQGIKERQLVSDTSGEDADFIGVAVLSARAHVVVLQERDGKVVGESSFSLKGEVEDGAQVLSEFLPQYYADAADLPDSVVIGFEIEEAEVLQQWLSERRGKQVKLRVPERGKRSKLLDLADKNASEKAKQMEASWEAEKRNTEGAIEELQRLLELPAKPDRIEGYDISHLGGTETVGSMVVTKHGKPANQEYRSFTIHTMKSGMVDDYRALKEVLTRRLRHLDEEREERKWADKGIVFAKNVKADGDHYKNCLIAKKDGEIVGSACLRTHENGVTELAWMQSEQPYQSDKLEQALARRMLRKLKTGKVYAIIHPGMEAAFADVGFRYVLKPPPSVQALIDERTKTSDDGEQWIAVLYDVLQHKADASFSCRPDLLVIDGGKGQLGVAAEVLKMLELDIPVIGLAKREEEVFVPGKSEPILFPKDSPAKFLLMRLRDESHRFANRHRERRGFKAAKQSILDTIPGIGPGAKKMLLSKFGSVDVIRDASDEELGAVLNRDQIEALRKTLE